jgi:hypothetical protein
MATFTSPNKFIMKVYSIIDLMVPIMYHKYYFVKYVWSKLKVVDFLENKNDSFLGTEGVPHYYCNIIVNTHTPM